VELSGFLLICIATHGESAKCFEYNKAQTRLLMSNLAQTS